MGRLLTRFNTRHERCWTCGKEFPERIPGGIETPDYPVGAPNTFWRSRPVDAVQAEDIKNWKFFCNDPCREAYSQRRKEEVCIG